MALFIPRISRNLRGILVLSKMHYCKNLRIIDEMELATGLEKAELMAIQAGNDDPFKVKIRKRGPGSKSEPNIVYSPLESRIVGCICDEDANHINWFTVYRDEPKRCPCGFWFKLENYNPL